MSHSWQQKWSRSAFWRRNIPTQHFDTPSTLTGALLARWLVQLAANFGCEAIIEIGFGSGVIQNEMAALDSCPPRIGIDIRHSPGVECRQLTQQWDIRTERWIPAGDDPDLASVLGEFTWPVLLFAVEWLDDLAAPVAERGRHGSLHELGPKGFVGTLGPADETWAERWWPQPGRLIVGRSRDVAWAWLARHLPSGSVLVTLDYGHIRSERPADGGFLAHRDGHRIPPDQSANLTAAVAVDSLAAAVEELGCLRQAYTRLAGLPADHWTTSAQDPLTALALRSQEQLLRDPRRFGAFWLVQHSIP